MKKGPDVTTQEPTIIQLPSPTTRVDGHDDRVQAYDDLFETLGSLHGRLARLGDLAESKLAAMRAADASRLHELAAEEAAELEALAAEDVRREAALARVAQGMPDRASARPRLAEVAETFSEPQRSKILGKSEGLRAMATRLAEKNALVADVARGLHNHVRGVFAEVAKVNQEAVVYGKDGREHQRTSKSWVDAVG